MTDSTQDTKDDFGAFQDSRLLLRGADFQIENGPERIVFQGKLEIERNKGSRNILRDLIWVLTNIRDAIPENASVGTASTPTIVSQWFSDGKWMGPMHIVAPLNKKAKPDGYRVKVVIADMAYLGLASKQMSRDEYEEAKRLHRIVFTTSKFETSKQAFDAAHEELLSKIEARKENPVAIENPENP